MAGFIAVLVAIFMPLFDGQNALDYLDNLYNSISKGRPTTFPSSEQEVEEHAGKRVTLRLAFDDEAQAGLAATLLEARRRRGRAAPATSWRSSGDRGRAPEQLSR